MTRMEAAHLLLQTRSGWPPPVHKNPTRNPIFCTHSVGALTLRPRPCTRMFRWTSLHQPSQWSYTEQQVIIDRTITLAIGPDWACTYGKLSLPFSTYDNHISFHQMQILLPSKRLFQFQTSDHHISSFLMALRNDECCMACLEVFNNHRMYNLSHGFWNHSVVDEN